MGCRGLARALGCARRQAGDFAAAAEGPAHRWGLDGYGSLSIAFGRVNYNDLTVLPHWESWLIREIIPKWPQDSG